MAWTCGACTYFYLLILALAAPSVRSLSGNRHNMMSFRHNTRSFVCISTSSSGGNGLRFGRSLAKAMQMQTDVSVSCDLLLATTEDVASVTMLDAIFEHTQGWEEQGQIQGATYWKHETGTYLWRIHQSFLNADDLDKQWEASTGIRPSGLLFLSRHAAASGNPSLTVHPIGNPNASAEPRSGGKAGVLPPPHPATAALFRGLSARARAAGPAVAGVFGVSLEATHHGPLCAAPAAFLEVGSTEEHWGSRPAARVWAATLAAHFGWRRAAAGEDGSPVAEGGGGGERGGEEQPPPPPPPGLLLPGEEAGGGGAAAAAARRWEDLGPEERERAVVLVGLGGGHYAPKHGDAARRPGAWLGHVLASYAFDFEGDAAGWQGAVAAAVASTRAGFPGCGAVVAHVDKKAFRGADRARLVDFLALELGVPHVFKLSELREREAAAAAATGVLEDAAAEAASIC